MQLFPPKQAPDAGFQDFLGLIQTSPAMLWMADRDGLCTFVGPAWLEFRRRTLEQELGCGWAEGIHPDDGDTCLREYWSAVTACRPFRLRYRLHSTDGTYVWIENSGAPWFRAGGESGGFIGRMDLDLRAARADHGAAQQLASLSVREREVLVLITQGFATKELATTLGISYKTADTHRSHLLKKLGLHHTAALVRFAVRAGLIEA